jgi:hypothetical protein
MPRGDHNPKSVADNPPKNRVQKNDHNSTGTAKKVPECRKTEPSYVRWSRICRVDRPCSPSLQQIFSSLRAISRGLHMRCAPGSAPHEAIARFALSGSETLSAQRGCHHHGGLEQHHPNHNGNERKHHLPILTTINLQLLNQPVTLNSNLTSTIQSLPSMT